MAQTLRTPVVVIVRDGWGRNPNPSHDPFNAVKLARTPRCDALLRDYPWTLIHTSGEEVGLPEGTMGNSEVGHQNIGAGRIVDQESVRITRSIRTGEFFENPALHAAVRQAKFADKYVHLLGLASDAGVHALLDHLYACVQLCARMGHNKVALHLFTDGRDTGPFTGKNFLRRIEEVCYEKEVGRIASICGRYYAMDRDNRWERVARAYGLLTGHGVQPSFDTPQEAIAWGAVFNAGKTDDTVGEEVDRYGIIPTFATVEEAVQDYYDTPTNQSQLGDEFVTPRMVGPHPERTRIKDGDSVIFFNYRGDRPRELTRAFVMPEFYGHVKPSPDTGAKGFDRGEKLDLAYVTLTAYEEQLNKWVQVAYPKPPKMKDIAGEVLSRERLKQFRCAETEKFPHVTFFFNDYRDDPFPGEDRAIVQSPKVATYDLQPEMNAAEVRDAVLAALDKDYALIVVNFANGDMVGHTGKLDAAIKAVETVDACVGAIVDKTLAKGGSLIVTADHGNAEQMWDPDTNAPHTAHTTYDVECIVVDSRYAASRGVSPRSLRDSGRLADILPTAFALMGLDPPAEMTGRSLLS